LEPLPSNQYTAKNFKQEFIKFDYALFKFINSCLKSNFLDFYMLLPSYCDFKGFNIFFFAALITSIVILWNNRKVKFLIALIILVNILTIGTVTTSFLKQYFGRPRPLSTFGYENVNTLFEMIYVRSFPSGHAESVSAICTFMFITVRKYWYWYIIFITCTGFYRIYAGSHFPSDILVGILVGIFSAYVVVNLFRKHL
jgi:undecaprenyl-diphosphatase